VIRYRARPGEPPTGDGELEGLEVVRIEAQPIFWIGSGALLWLV